MLSIKINANDLETLMTLNTNVRDFKYRTAAEITVSEYENIDGIKEFQNVAEIAYADAQSVICEIAQGTSVSNEIHRSV